MEAQGGIEHLNFSKRLRVSLANPGEGLILVEQPQPQLLVQLTYHIQSLAISIERGLSTKLLFDYLS